MIDLRQRRTQSSGSAPRGRAPIEAPSRTRGSTPWPVRTSGRARRSPWAPAPRGRAGSAHICPCYRRLAGCCAPNEHDDAPTPGSPSPRRPRKHPGLRLVVRAGRFSRARPFPALLLLPQGDGDGARPPSDRQLTRALIVPMHGTQRARPSGASVGRRQASTSSAPP